MTTLKIGGFWDGTGTISWNLVIIMFNAMPVENILPRVWDLIKWNTWNGWSWFWTDGESTLWLRHFEETSNFRSNNGWQDFQECLGKDSTMWLTGYYVFLKYHPAYVQHIPKVMPPSIYSIYPCYGFSYSLLQSLFWKWSTWLTDIVYIQNKISDQVKKNLVGKNFKMAVSGMFEMKFFFFI